MGIVELMLLETCASGSLLVTARAAQSRANVQADLMEWNRDGKPTPFLDPFLEKAAGIPSSPAASKMHDALIDMLREVVNRKAFRHLVHGLANKDSRIQSWMNSLVRNKGGLL